MPGSLATLLAIAFASQVQTAPVIDGRFSTSTVRCEPEQHIRNSVHAFLGRDPFLSAAQLTHGAPIFRLDVRVVGVSDADSLIAIEIVDRDAPEHLRRYEGRLEHCAALLDQASTTIALWVEPMLDVSTAAAVHTPTSPPATAAAATTPTDAPATRAAPQTPREPPAWRLAAHLIGGAGDVPGVSFGGGLEGGVAWTTTSWGPLERIGVRLDVQGRAPSSTDDVFTPDVPPHIVVTAAALGIAACGELGWFALCPMVRGSALAVSPQNLTNTQDTWSAAVGLGLRGGVEFPLGAGLALSAQVDALGQLLQPQAQANGGSDVIWSASPVAFQLGVGVSWRPVAPSTPPKDPASSRQ